MNTGAGSPLDRLVTLPPFPADQPTLGWELIKWGVKYLKHPNGERAGQRWQWIDSQVRFFLWWYAVDENGDWLFHHGVRRLVKGTGKSPVAGLWALGELCAPVRLKGFDPQMPGGCVGKPVSMPWVQIAATAESQTSNTMRMVRAFAPKKSRVVEEFGLDPGKVQYYKVPEGKLEVITSSATSAEGAEVTAAVADETEHWRPANGGVELSTTLADNLAKSGSRMLETANSWVPGQESVAESTYNAWIAQEEGRTRGDTRILYDARIAPPETDMADEASLRRALDFVYDDCWWVNKSFIINRIWDPRSRVDDSKRKYLNWPTTVSDAWLKLTDWQKIADPLRVVEEDEDVVLFFDGSKSQDATALLGCCMSDGHVFCVDVWEPENQYDPDDVVDTAAVDLAVNSAFERYTVVGFFADVKEWEGFVKVTWPQRYAEDLLIKAVPGGKDPQPIAWDMRTNVRDFTLAAELTEREILEEQFTQDGDSRVARHVSAARCRANRWGISISKATPNSPRKIDAAVCVIGVRMVRRRVLASKEWQNHSRGRKLVVL